MKKKNIFAVLIIMILTLGLSACGSEPQKKEIELTPDNVEGYIQFDVLYGDTEHKTIVGLPVHTTDVALDTYLTTPGQLSNVKITGELHCGDSYYWNSGEEGYVEGKEDCLFLEFNLPVDGEHNESHEVCSMYVSDTPDNCYFVVTDIEGTFIPEN